MIDEKTDQKCDWKAFKKILLKIFLCENKKTKEKSEKELLYL